MHDTVDRQYSKECVRESKYSIFKRHKVLISGTAQFCYILQDVVMLMSRDLSLMFTFLSLIVVTDKIIFSNRALPVLYGDVRTIFQMTFIPSQFLFG